MSDAILLFGPPGVGKGTQANLLAGELRLPHVATGDLFRDHLSRRTELGNLAQAYMNRGELVPDEVTIGMLRERIGQADARNGVLLDGFPRTAGQADALAHMLAERGGRVRIVLYIAAPRDVLLERLAHRWTCSHCGAIYNAMTDPPHRAGVCDRCGGPVVQRADDNPDVQRRRVDIYLEQTMPLVDYYRQRGLLEEIDGTRSIDEVHRVILDAIARSAGEPC